MASAMTSQRKIPQQARSHALVEAILDAAAQILQKHGRRAATTNAIAGRAGVSIGSLYQYFPNGEAIVVALAEREALAGSRQDKKEKGAVIAPATSPRLVPSALLIRDTQRAPPQSGLIIGTP